MSAIRATKSIEALSASLNRALASARQLQVTAAKRAQQRAGTATGSRVGDFERIAARRRTNLLIGTLDHYRSSPAAWGRAQRRGLPEAG